MESDGDRWRVGEPTIQIGDCCEMPDCPGKYLAYQQGLTATILKGLDRAYNKSQKKQLSKRKDPNEGRQVGIATMSGVDGSGSKGGNDSDDKGSDSDDNGEDGEGEEGEEDNQNISGDEGDNQSDNGSESGLAGSEIGGLNRYDKRSIFTSDDKRSIFTDDDDNDDDDDDNNDDDDDDNNDDDDDDKYTDPAERFIDALHDMPSKSCLDLLASIENNDFTKG